MCEFHEGNVEAAEHLRVEYYRNYERIKFAESFFNLAIGGVIVLTTLSFFSESKIGVPIGLALLILSGSFKYSQSQSKELASEEFEANKLAAAQNNLRKILEKYNLPDSNTSEVSATTVDTEHGYAVITEVQVAYKDKAGGNHSLRFEPEDNNFILVVDDSLSGAIVDEITL